MDRLLMSSGELARTAGVNVETLRYYERRGLLPKPDRASNGHRRYSDKTIERLHLIRRAQTLGFSLPEITTLLEATQRDDGPAIFLLVPAYDDPGPAPIDAVPDPMPIPQTSPAQRLRVPESWIENRHRADS